MILHLKKIKQQIFIFIFNVDKKRADNVIKIDMLEHIYIAIRYLHSDSEGRIYFTKNTVYKSNGLWLNVII